MKLTILINYSDSTRALLRRVKKMTPLLKSAGIKIHAEHTTPTTAKWKNKIPVLFEGAEPLAAGGKNIIPFLDELIVAAQKDLKPPGLGIGDRNSRVETEAGLDEWQTNIMFNGRFEDQGRDEGCDNGVNTEDINARLVNYNNKCKPPPKYRSTGLAEKLGMRGCNQPDRNAMREDRNGNGARNTEAEPQRVMPGLTRDEGFAMPEMETPLDEPEYPTDGQSLLDQFGGLID